MLYIYFTLTFSFLHYKMYNVNISGKHKYETALSLLSSYLWGLWTSLYSYSQSHQAPNVKSLNVKMGRDVCNSTPFYGISTKN